MAPQALSRWAVSNEATTAMAVSAPAIKVEADGIFLFYPFHRLLLPMRTLYFNILMFQLWDSWFIIFSC
jgi:hypothetical protein